MTADLIKARHVTVTEAITDRQTRLITMNAFLRTFSRQDNILTEFDEKLRGAAFWTTLLLMIKMYGSQPLKTVLKFKNKTL